MLASNRELSCLVVIGSPEPQVQTNEVHDFFMLRNKHQFYIKTKMGFETKNEIFTIELRHMTII